MAELPTIASFWTGDPLSMIERLCLKSFLDAGHRMVLYSYGAVEGVPDGVEMADANDILAEPETITTHTRTQSPAPFADRFRYHLLAKRPGVIWADTDAYCLRPFENPTGYFFAFADEKSRIVANGVLALPPESATLRELIAWTENEYAVLPWLPATALDQACRAARDGEPVHVSEFPWGAWGPSAITWVLRHTGELEHAMPHDTLYPVSYPDRRKIFKRARHVMRSCTDRTMSIHFYGRRIRDRLLKEYDGIPPQATVLHRLAEKHEIATT
ncbi:hypothetical protein [Jannaschia ovalis]|uniref:Alpha 1,4-glycosyltransferase conserved region n=1 Tax=Jannaschia ovalis TaxID=3038773 RepID=A0ABY8LCZ6_9RHOB|nr:hypothetical protein [Jannaschia sp. GRR-S6-38]WGH79192.1 hypothetical protein P8627_02705 [Jannaschia sp. GRR-S6-38]